MKPTNKGQLIHGMSVLEHSVSVMKCRKYISHLNKVLTAIIEVHGRPLDFEQQDILLFVYTTHSVACNFPPNVCKWKST
jgi:hypothetical protein